MIGTFKYLFVLLTILILSVSCSAQRPIIREASGIDRLEIDIKRGPGLPSVLEDSEVSMLSKFGTPTTQQDYEYEMMEVTGKLYKYLSDEIYTVNNEFYSFVFNSSLFQLGIDNNYIKVGDNISEVNDFYGDANSFKSSTNYRIPLKRGDQEEEGDYLIIEFNSSNIITKIMKYEY